jgi:hypothetical protein
MGVADEAPNAEDDDDEADAEVDDDCNQPRVMLAFISAGDEMPPTPLPIPSAGDEIELLWAAEDRDADAEEAEEEEEDCMAPKRGNGDWYMLCVEYRAALPRSCGDDM